MRRVAAAAVSASGEPSRFWDMASRKTRSTLRVQSQYTLSLRRLEARKWMNEMEQCPMSSGPANVGGVESLHNADGRSYKCHMCVYECHTATLKDVQAAYTSR